ncbi:unnamed protein product [Arabidopsis thaliana]|uniref:(thale cress) hypothetical protein n=1 Tax=Arabidopsis thaliana TaxID=3702 RepID=A0A7G2EX96_ARATH|nr:unnamed protein product [Arabidopsis thaliana]
MFTYSWIIVRLLSSRNSMLCTLIFEEHDMFELIEKMLLEVKATLAEITEQLMVSKNPDVLRLRVLLSFLTPKG